MIGNHVRLFWRHVRHRAGSFAISVSGLAAGLAGCLLIGLFIGGELSFDRFHDKSDRIFRLVSFVRPPGDAEVLRTASNGWPAGRAITQEFPEVERMVYLRGWPALPVRHAGRWRHPDMLWAGADFFRIFSFPFTAGDPESALEAPFSLVLSEQAAETFFGRDDALGRTLQLGEDFIFTVTGIARVPSNSHIQFDMLLSFNTLESAIIPDYARESFQSGWYNMNVSNYLLLKTGVSPESFESRISELVDRRLGEYLGYSTTLGLERLEDVYLRSGLGNPLGPTGDLGTVRLLSLIAAFLLVIAGINFVNLATARAGDRAREVGLRRMAGSTRGALARRFLFESTLTGLGAFLLALPAARLLLPVFNSLIQRDYTAAGLFRPDLATTLLALSVLTGAAAGAYPAVVLSSFRPITALRGRSGDAPRGGRLRRMLVVFQFAVSSLLIFGALVVNQQLRWMKSRNPGFAAHQVVVLDAAGVPGETRSRPERAIKQELSRHPAVSSVSVSAAVPGRPGWRGQWAFPEGRAEDDGVELEYIPVDHDFVETMGLEIVAGRDLSETFATDARIGVLINQTAVETIGWESPDAALGKTLSSPGSGKPEGRVVGVVRDYHHHGLRESIGPVMMAVNPGVFRYFALRFEEGDARTILAHAEKVWNLFFPGFDFDYFFLDDGFARQYRGEARLSRILGVFAALAAGIAGLGLFGLASWSVRRRVREIGVRKVLGASPAGIVRLLTRETARLILIALAIAAPIGYGLMRLWMAGFAYRAGISPLLFPAVALGLFAVAALTIGGQSLRASRTDPARALRHE